MAAPLNEHDAPQLPLTPLRRALVVCGMALLLTQTAAAAALAPLTTGPGDADGGVLAAMFGASLIISCIAVLLLIRQANLPDIATASMLVTIPPYAVFALVAAYDGPADDNAGLVDALFLGVTGGALAAMLVWGAAMGVARALRLPRSQPQER
jgi:hypothetical protein